MEKFSDMKKDEIIEVINGSKELRNELVDYVQEIESFWLGEKLNCFDKNAVEYEIGLYETSYMWIKDNSLFVEGVRKSCDKFGLNQETEKMLRHCEKLKDSNLFDYWCKKLCRSYYKTELKPIVKGIEDVIYELSCGSVGERAKFYVGDFIDNFLLDYLWDRETKTYYQPCRIPA